MKKEGTDYFQKLAIKLWSKLIKETFTYIVRLTIHVVGDIDSSKKSSRFRCNGNIHDTIIKKQ